MLSKVIAVINRRTFWSTLNFDVKLLNSVKNQPTAHEFLSVDRITKLTHSLDRLTGNRSLRPPDVAITSHVPSSIYSEPDIDLQLADPGLSRTTSRTFSCRSVIRSVTGTGVDNQTKYFVCGY